MLTLALARAGGGAALQLTAKLARPLAASSRPYSGRRRSPRKRSVLAQQHAEDRRRREQPGDAAAPGAGGAKPRRRRKPRPEQSTLQGPAVQARLAKQGQRLGGGAHSRLGTSATVRLAPGTSVEGLARSASLPLRTLLRTCRRLKVGAKSKETQLSLDTQELLLMELGVAYRRPAAAAAALDEALPQPGRAAAAAQAAAAAARGEAAAALSLREHRDTAGYPERPPVVSVMGHVDHGKTTLLDALRGSSLAEAEAGGITQRLGAFSARDGALTVLDTPGHATFTAMRAQGSALTDLVVLVVAADDGVQPQTEEVVALIQHAGVPTVVALTKTDRLSALELEAAERGVRADLAALGLPCEGDEGGTAQLVHVAATTGAGVDELLEAVMLEAEILELRAAVDAPGEAIVLESHLDARLGAVASVLVRWGTLRAGAFAVVGDEAVRVRQLLDDHDRPVEAATPSHAVRVLGLWEPAAAGDDLVAFEDEEQAREVAEERERRAELEALTTQESGVRSSGSRGTGLGRRRRRGVAENRRAAAKAAAAAGAEEPEDPVISVPLIVKADGDNVVQAIHGAAAELPSDEVRVDVVHSSIGNVTKMDVTRAATAKACLVAFGVKVSKEMDNYARRQRVKILQHDVIYSMIDDVKKLLNDAVPPETVHKTVAKATVLQPLALGRGASVVAGCRVDSGTLRRNQRFRVLRGGEQVAAGLKSSSLRHFADVVEEVASGLECGLALDDFSDIREGDVIECYEVKEVRRSVV